MVREALNEVKGDGGVSQAPHEAFSVRFSEQQLL